MDRAAPAFVPCDAFADRRVDRSAPVSFTRVRSSSFDAARHQREQHADHRQQLALEGSRALRRRQPHLQSVAGAPAHAVASFPHEREIVAPVRSFPFPYPLAFHRRCLAIRCCSSVRGRERRAAGRLVRARRAVRASARRAPPDRPAGRQFAAPGHRALEIVAVHRGSSFSSYAQRQRARGRAGTLHSALRGRRNEEGGNFDLHRCRRLPRRTDVRSGLLRDADAGVIRPEQVRRQDRRRHHARAGAVRRHRKGVEGRRFHVVGCRW